jgi:threonylcarbamoyladenosine tRNA methylthiotransferase MtaB
MGRAGVEKIVATGCWATLNPQEAAAFPGVRKVVSNAEKDRLVAELLDLPRETFDLEPVERHLVPGTRLRTRAFIKVQDGCDNHCTFCLTKLARGSGRSRPMDEILKDIRAASENGSHIWAQEVVLTGVHLGSWGQDLAADLHLRHLVRAILEKTEVPRLRLSSVEPWDLDEEFFRLWENPRLCRHLHLPLQSGCAATLRRMGRNTTPEAYARLVECARAVIPGIAITTDIITGFPGETETEFAESLHFIKELQFSDGHVFTYSARPGTAAARMPGQVAFAERKERNARARELIAQSAQEYRSGFIGQVLPVLWESATALEPEGWKLSGLTSNYLRVSAHAPQRLWNQITPVRLLGLAGGNLFGQIQA